MKVATLQFGIKPGETKQEAFDHVSRLMDQIKEPVDLVVLPELWNVGFFSFDQYKASAEDLHGETYEFMAQKARDFNSNIMTGSYVVKMEDGYYNTSTFLNRKGEMLGDYQKIHLFGYGSKEREVLNGGKKLTVVDSDIGKVGLTICYDLRFPELYRKLADMGAEILIDCAAWPYPRCENWTVLNQARAAENQAYFISCCCAGGAVGQTFIGRSMVVDPWGTPIAALAGDEGVMVNNIYPEQVAKIRANVPFLQDRVFPVADLA